ncbi:hypothetical protein [Nocardioides sp.]|uniref:hypothetical protein n=1 Tax=Nocardioides sp. TaxID=35761 RepID=UPI0035164C69
MRATKGGEPEQYWYCLTHERVEGRDGCPNRDRLGPYDDAASAARALEIAAERTRAWDREDADPDADGSP